MGLPYNEREEQLLSETRKNVKLREQVAALSAQLAKVRERCEAEQSKWFAGRAELAREILAILEE